MANLALGFLLQIAEAAAEDNRRRKEGKEERQEREREAGGLGLDLVAVQGTVKGPKGSEISFFLTSPDLR